MLTLIAFAVAITLDCVLIALIVALLFQLRKPAKETPWGEFIPKRPSAIDEIEETTDHVLVGQR